MCGRFTLTASPEKILEYFQIDSALDFTPRYNIAPSQSVLIVRLSNDQHKMEFSFMRWGFIPNWQQEDKISSQWINARAETVADKPLFKDAISKRRCLIVADGFYEWQVISKKQKQPYYIFKKDHRPFGIAAIWEKWVSKDGRIIESCALLTTNANPLVEPIHNRMPVILQKTQFPDWFNPEKVDIEKIKPLFAPYSPTDLTCHPVSTYVNSPVNDHRQCIEKIQSAE